MADEEHAANATATRPGPAAGLDSDMTKDTGRSASHGSGSSNANDEGGAQPGGLHHLSSKALTPRAEHLRFGHVDYEEVEEDEEKRHYLIRRPRAHQWFYKGKLFRSSEGRSSSRMELFFDLVYVAIIAVLAEAAIEQPNGAGLVKYVITYLPAFLIWDSTRELVNILWNDDVAQKTCLVWVMMLLLVYGNSAPLIGSSGESHAGSTSSGTAEEAAAAPAHRFLRRAESSSHGSGDAGRTEVIVLYIVAQWSLNLGRFFCSFYVFQYRKQFWMHTIWSFVPLAFYIGAIFASTRAAIALVFVGLFLDYFGWQAIYSPHLKKRLKLVYSSALNIEHEVDRHADFYTIVMGEFIYSAISGTPAGLGIDRATGRACMVLLIAASLQLLYMLSSGSLSYVHPLRHSGNTATLWFMAHIPAVAALTLAGDASHVLILEDVGVAQGIRWYFCAGITIGLVCTWILAMMEIDKDEGKLVLRKELRLLPRMMSAIIIVFIPLVDEVHLSSTGMVGICAALCYSTLLWETIFSLHKPDRAYPFKGFFGMPRLVDPKLSQSVDGPDAREQDAVEVPRA